MEKVPIEKKTNFLFSQKEHPKLATLLQVVICNCFVTPSTTLPKLSIVTEKVAKLILKSSLLKEVSEKIS
ncbi:hypothetical protein [Tenacibaculum sp. 190524A02b]|uniref:hypothetical protein n=1 Tax=Tenacibaculum vairaonense TaxID=3137860 RepID=UPI0031FAE8E3